MSNLADYFHTDWEAMTTSDWVGTILTVVVFLLMVVVYVYVLRPSKKEKLESYKHIPMDDDERKDSGEKNGR